MDEPTTYLDPHAQRDLVRLLRTLPQPKVIVTHDVLFAHAIGTRAVFFEAGRVIADGDVATLVEQFAWRPE